MTYDLFSDDTRHFIRSATVRTTLTLNPPYNEDSSEHAASSTFMTEAIAWAGVEVDAATADGRDLVFLLFIPYEIGHASHAAVAALGPRARIAVRIKSDQFSFESGNLWHSPHESWSYPCGPGKAASFPSAIIEVASSLGREFCDSIHTSAHAAQILQWVSSTRPRAGISGVSLPSSVWPGLGIPLWSRLRHDPLWVADQHNTPIDPDLGPDAGVEPPSSWASRPDVFSLFRAVSPRDWQTLLLPESLEVLPLSMGLAGWKKTWRPSLLALDHVWRLYEPLRRPTRLLPSLPRVRYAMRAHASSRRIATSMHISLSSLIDDAPSRYGLDLGII
jgi:hypothetical protein